MPVNNLIQLRRGDDWGNNPVLSGGEPGLDSNYNIFKIGDGITAWSGLAPANFPIANSGDGIKYNGIIWETDRLIAHSGNNISIFVNDSGYLQELSQDLTPQLGGDLDINTYSVTGVGNINIDGDITAERLYGDLDGPIVVECKNQTGSDIAAGTPVYVSGYYGTNGKAFIAPADAGDPSKMPAIGIIETTLTSDSEGHVHCFGLSKGFDTSSFTVGQTVYVSNGGGLTNSRPSGATDLVQNIGRVLRSDSSQGRILVLGPGRTNDTPNSLDITGTITAPNIGAGEDDSVVVLDSDGKLRTDEIDSRVWGTSLLANVVEDTSPQLGGTLDANSNIIDMGVNSITDTAVGQWNTAYGWGDHSAVGYLTSHPAITAAGSVDNSNGTVVQDITLDSNGHITALGAVDLDSRYYTETEIDNFNYVDGNGTANYLSKWSDGDTVTNSVVYDDGTNVGIGTASPSYKLEVNGHIGLTDSGFYASPTGVMIGTSGWLYNDGQTTLSHGNFSDNGDAQNSSYVLRTSTTNATFTTLQNNGSNVILASNRTMMFTANIVARRTNGQDNAAYKLEGVLVNDGYEASILGTPVKTIFYESDSSWDVQAILSGGGAGASDYLLIQGKGAASKNINWVCKLDLLEVGGNIDGYTEANTLNINSNLMP